MIAIAVHEQDRRNLRWPGRCLRLRPRAKEREAE
jgi:hypothetical protein